MFAEMLMTQQKLPEIMTFSLPKNQGFDMTNSSFLQTPVSSEYQVSLQPPHFLSGMGVHCDETSLVQFLLWFQIQHGHSGSKKQQNLTLHCLSHAEC